MDLDALHSTLLSISVASDKVRDLRGRLPDRGDLAVALNGFFQEIENDLRMAKATLGGQLGFDLCPRCWPPELISQDTKQQFNCPVCGALPMEDAA